MKSLLYGIVAIHKTSDCEKNNNDDVVVAVSKVVSRYFHCLQVVSIGRISKNSVESGVIWSSHFITFLQIACIIRSRIVIGAAFAIGSAIDEVAQSRFRCIGFFFQCEVV